LPPLYFIILIFDRYRIYEAKKIFLFRSIRLKEIREVAERIHICRALNALALAPGPDKARPVQLLQMVRYGGRGYAQVTHQVAHTLIGPVTRTAGYSALATASQAHKNFQAMRIRQSLKNFGIFFGVIYFTVRHIWNYNTI
jgi:hypothetical protein